MVNKGLRGTILPRQRQRGKETAKELLWYVWGCASVRAYYSARSRNSAPFDRIVFVCACLCTAPMLSSKIRALKNNPSCSPSTACPSHFNARAIFVPTHPSDDVPLHRLLRMGTPKVARWAIAKTCFFSHETIGVRVSALRIGVGLFRLSPVTLWKRVPWTHPRDDRPLPFSPGPDCPESWQSPRYTFLPRLSFPTAAPLASAVDQVHGDIWVNTEIHMKASRGWTLKRIAPGISKEPTATLKSARTAAAT